MEKGEGSGGTSVDKSGRRGGETEKERGMGGGQGPLKREHSV